MVNEFSEVYEKMKSAVSSGVVGALRKVEAERLDKWEEMMRGVVKQATDMVANRIQDETQIERMAESARQGATYTAVLLDVNRFVKEITTQWEPQMKAMEEVVGRAFRDGISDAARQIVMERVLRLTNPEESTTP